jgi:voltage-gated potassium channel
LNKEQRAEAYEAFDRAVEVPALILSVLIIPLLIPPLFFDLAHDVETTFLIIDYTIWALFGLELVIKTYLSPDRLRYLVTHWFDVLIVAIPFARPLRIARSARALRGLRTLFTIALITRIVVRGRDLAGQHGLHYAVTIGLVLIFACASAVYLFERNGDGNIQSFGISLWWAATTVTTVGYGDTFPSTPEGRGVGIFLMLVGITLFSLLTANISAFFVESRRNDEPSMSDLMAKLTELEDLVKQLQAAPSAEVQANA